MNSQKGPIIVDLISDESESEPDESNVSSNNMNITPSSFGLNRNSISNKRSSNVVDLISDGDDDDDDHYDDDEDGDESVWDAFLTTLVDSNGSTPQGQINNNPTTHNLLKHSQSNNITIPKTPSKARPIKKLRLDDDSSSNRIFNNIRIKQEFVIFKVGFGEANIQGEVVEVQNPFIKLQNDAKTPQNISTSTINTNVTSTSTSVMDDDDDEAIEYIGGNMTVASDMPHARESCPQFKFNSTDTSQCLKICKQCYCYVCEINAQDCYDWNRHCLATYKNPIWKRERTARQSKLLKLLPSARQKLFFGSFRPLLENSYTEPTPSFSSDMGPASTSGPRSQMNTSMAATYRHALAKNLQQAQQQAQHQQLHQQQRLSSALQEIRRRLSATSTTSATSEITSTSNVSSQQPIMPSSLLTESTSTSTVAKDIRPTLVMTSDTLIEAGILFVCAIRSAVSTNSILQYQDVFIEILVELFLHPFNTQMIRSTIQKEIQVYPVQTLNSLCDTLMVLMKNSEWLKGSVYGSIPEIISKLNDNIIIIIFNTLLKTNKSDILINLPTKIRCEKSKSQILWNFLDKGFIYDKIFFQYAYNIMQKLSLKDWDSFCQQMESHIIKLSLLQKLVLLSLILYIPNAIQCKIVLGRNLLDNQYDLNDFTSSPIAILLEGIDVMILKTRPSPIELIIKNENTDANANSDANIIRNINLFFFNYFELAQYEITLILELIIILYNDSIRLFEMTTTTSTTTTSTTGVSSSSSQSKNHSVPSYSVFSEQMTQLMKRISQSKFSLILNVFLSASTSSNTTSSITSSSINSTSSGNSINSIQYKGISSLLSNINIINICTNLVDVYLRSGASGSAPSSTSASALSSFALSLPLTLIDKWSKIALPFTTQNDNNNDTGSNNNNTNNTATATADVADVIVFENTLNISSAIILCPALTTGWISHQIINTNISSSSSSGVELDTVSGSVTSVTSAVTLESDQRLELSLIIPLRILWKSFLCYLQDLNKINENTTTTTNSTICTYSKRNELILLPSMISNAIESIFHTLHLQELSSVVTVLRRLCPELWGPFAILFSLIEITAAGNKFKSLVPAVRRTLKVINDVDRETNCFSLNCKRDHTEVMLLSSKEAGDSNSNSNSNCNDNNTSATTTNNNNNKSIHYSKEFWMNALSHLLYQTLEDEPSAAYLFLGTIDPLQHLLSKQKNIPSFIIDLNNINVEDLNSEKFIILLIEILRKILDMKTNDNNSIQSIMNFALKNTLIMNKLFIFYPDIIAQIGKITLSPMLIRKIRIVFQQCEHDDNEINGLHSDIRIHLLNISHQTVTSITSLSSSSSSSSIKAATTLLYNDLWNKLRTDIHDILTFQSSVFSKLGRAPRVYGPLALPHEAIVTAAVLSLDDIVQTLYNVHFQPVVFSDNNNGNGNGNGNGSSGDSSDFSEMNIVINSAVEVLLASASRSSLLFYLDLFAEKFLLISTKYNCKSEYSYNTTSTIVFKREPEEIFKKFSIDINNLNINSDILIIEFCIYTTCTHTIIIDYIKLIILYENSDIKHKIIKRLCKWLPLAKLNNLINNADFIEISFLLLSKECRKDVFWNLLHDSKLCSDVTERMLTMALPKITSPVSINNDTDTDTDKGKVYENENEKVINKDYITSNTNISNDSNSNSNSQELFHWLLEWLYVSATSGDCCISNDIREVIKSHIERISLLIHTSSGNSSSNNNNYMNNNNTKTTTSYNDMKYSNYNNNNRNENIESDLQLQLQPVSTSIHLFQFIASSTIEKYRYICTHCSSNNIQIRDKLLSFAMDSHNPSSGVIILLQEREFKRLFEVLSGPLFVVSKYTNVAMKTITQIMDIKLLQSSTYTTSLSSSTSTSTSTIPSLTTSTSISLYKELEKPESFFRHATVYFLSESNRNSCKELKNTIEEFFLHMKEIVLYDPFLSAYIDCLSFTGVNLQNIQRLLFAVDQLAQQTSFDLLGSSNCNNDSNAIIEYIITSAVDAPAATLLKINLFSELIKMSMDPLITSRLFHFQESTTTTTQPPYYSINNEYQTSYINTTDIFITLAGKALQKIVSFCIRGGDNILWIDPSEYVSASCMEALTRVVTDLGRPAALALEPVVMTTLTTLANVNDNANVDVFTDKLSQWLDAKGWSVLIAVMAAYAMELSYIPTLFLLRKSLEYMAFQVAVRVASVRPHFTPWLSVVKRIIKGHIKNTATEMDARSVGEVLRILLDKTDGVLFDWKWVESVILLLFHAHRTTVLMEFQMMCNDLRFNIGNLIVSNNEILLALTTKLPAHVILSNQLDYFKLWNVALKIGKQTVCDLLIVMISNVTSYLDKERVNTHNKTRFASFLQIMRQILVNDQDPVSLAKWSAIMTQIRKVLARKKTILVALNEIYL